MTTYLDLVLRLFLSASIGLALALNAINGEGILNIFLEKGAEDISLPLFLALDVLFVLVTLTVLVHILLREKQFTFPLTLVGLFFGLGLAVVPYVAGYPDPFQIIGPVLAILQLPLPFLVQKVAWV